MIPNVKIFLRNIFYPIFFGVLFLTAVCAPQLKEVPVTEFYDITASTITGETITLSKYKGKVLLIVNTASKCGFTYQYDGLQELHEKYEEKGLVVLGFPSNNFLGQEPGTNEEIQTFCRLNYGVTFPMFEKISVKGDNQHPLYIYLTSKQTNPEFGGRITWNFNKFLISRTGKIVDRFSSRTKPQDEKLIAAIEAELNK